MYSKEDSYDHVNYAQYFLNQTAEWKENPLEAIGLSPAILSLGLSPDELHRLCRRMARDLLASVHPDHNNGVTSALVQKFSDALNLLNDRKLFNHALATLQAKDAKFKRENVELRAQIRTLKTRIVNLNEEITFLTQRLDQYEKQKQHRQ